MIQFDVQDTGIGMSVEEMDTLFCPFTQADTSHTRRFGGTGLGLVISRRLAELLGGTVGVVDSRPGVGTTLRLRVATGPLDGVRTIKDLSSQMLSTADQRTGRSALPGALNCRILLAEDAPDNQRLVSHILGKAGAEVTIVENGKLAVDRALSAEAEGSPFDVILMDMQMPVMDGYEAAGLLRQKGYRGAIVALTAHAMLGDREKCLRAGCDDFTAKPVNRTKLIEVIRAHTTPQPLAAPGVGAV
jgi:CheY-like chemotaxis protein